MRRIDTRNKSDKVCSHLEYWFSTAFVREADNLVTVHCSLDDKLPPIWYRFPFYRKTWDESEPRDISDTELEYFNKYMW